MEKGLDESSLNLLIDRINRQLKSIDDLILYFEKTKDKHNVKKRLYGQRVAYEHIKNYIGFLLSEQEKE